MGYYGNDSQQGGGYGTAAGQDWPEPENTAVNALDIQLPEFAYEADADETEQRAEENQYFNIEKPGHYTLVVVNVLPKVEKKMYNVFVGGKPARFEGYNFSVVLGDDCDPRYQIIDTIVLPTGNSRAEVEAYNRGSKNPDGKFPGFHAEKAGHFLNRLIGGFSKGQPIPPAARNPRAWLGRKVEADIAMSKRRPKGKDPKTGADTFYEPRPQIELFSYRTHGTVEQAPAGQAATAPVQTTTFAGNRSGARNI